MILEQCGPSSVAAWAGAVSAVSLLVIWIFKARKLTKICTCISNAALLHSLGSTLQLARISREFKEKSKRIQAFRAFLRQHTGENVTTFSSVGEIIGCKDKTSSWYLIGFPDGSNIGSKVSCRRETYINRHAGTSKAETKNTISLGTAQFCYVRSRIEWVSALL